MATAKRVAHYLFMFFFTVLASLCTMFRVVKRVDFNFTRQCFSRSLLMFGVRVMVMDVYLSSARAHYKVSVLVVVFPFQYHRRSQLNGTEKIDKFTLSARLNNTRY
jgi:hypothetical protein